MYWPILGGMPYGMLGKQLRAPQDYVTIQPQYSPEKKEDLD
jgi:hypothetical protein